MCKVVLASPQSSGASRSLSLRGAEENFEEPRAVGGSGEGPRQAVAGGGSLRVSPGLSQLAGLSISRCVRLNAPRIFAELHTLKQLLE